MTRDELVETLKELLREVLRARFDGAAYAKLARAHGYADGYMRALLDAGLVDKRELLKVVGAERRRFVDAA
ncbi:MAG: hypothetical protein AAF447_16710 [Myxococcota bacterium]